jgi:hypothetical protein
MNSRREFAVFYSNFSNNVADCLGLQTRIKNSHTKLTLITYLRLLTLKIWLLMRKQLRLTNMLLWWIFRYLDYKFANLNVKFKCRLYIKCTFLATLYEKFANYQGGKLANWCWVGVGGIVACRIDRKVT